MINVIIRLREILNSIKGFDNVGYSSESAPDGYMMLDYKGKRYAVKLVEIVHPSDNPFNDMKRIRYYL